MASMSSLGGEGASMGLANIKSLVGLGSDDITQASEDYLRGVEEHQEPRGEHAGWQRQGADSHDSGGDEMTEEWLE